MKEVLIENRRALPEAGEEQLNPALCPAARWSIGLCTEGLAGALGAIVVSHHVSEPLNIRSHA
jgi:hypothetical protein